MSYSPQQSLHVRMCVGSAAKSLNISAGFVSAPSALLFGCVSQCAVDAVLGADDWYSKMSCAGSSHCHLY